MKTKKDIANQISEEFQLSKKEANAIVNSVFNTVQTDLNDEGKVQIFGFGTFTVEVRPAKDWVNPRTGEVKELPKKRYPKFKPAKAFQELVDF